MPNHFYQTVDGWFGFQDVYAQALSEAPDGAKFVEIGSWLGRSAAWMAVEIEASGKAIDFYCVDTWAGSVDSPWMAEQIRERGGKQAFIETMERGGVAHLINVIEAESVEAAKTFEDESLDFVFVDGSHDYESVRADVRAWYPKVKRGGVIAGDDTDWPGVLIGVHETIPHSQCLVRTGTKQWWHRKQWSTPGRWHTQRPAPEGSDCLFYIPYVNHRESLERAVQSLRRVWPSLIVIDQTEEGVDADWLDEIGGLYRIPFRAISFSQMMNWARDEAVRRDVPLLGFMHSDAECADLDVAPSVIATARDGLQKRVGVTFTNYDALALFNVAALVDAGPWDETFEWYFADNDYYRRLRLRGWSVAEFGGEKVRHAISQTIRTDSRIQTKVSESWGWHTRHYQHKWGGPPGAEVHRIPYNGSP